VKKIEMKKMTLSQKRKLVAATSLPISAIILMVSFQNCSPGVVQSARLESEGTALSTNLDLDADTKPVTVAYSENILISMQQLTGIQTPSTRTLTAATSAKAKISETGKVDSVNAPALMAVTNVAGEICLDLIIEEKAKTADSRRFFNLVDFAAAPATISTTGKSDLVRRMARNFWGRNETVAEKTVLLTSIDSVTADPRRTIATDAAETEDVMLFTCTAMLSSIDAIAFK
jgi:hypothetical protein